MGRIEGRAEGRAKERLSNLHMVLRGKFKDISAAQMATVFEHCEKPDLFMCIIKAATVDELLKSLC